MKELDREDLLPMELRVTVELPEEIFREYSQLKHRRKLTGRVQQAIHAHELGSSESGGVGMEEVLQAMKGVSESVGKLAEEMAEERKERKKEMSELREELGKLKSVVGDGESFQEKKENSQEHKEEDVSRKGTFIKSEPNNSEDIVRKTVGIGEEDWGLPEKETNGERKDSEEYLLNREDEEKEKDTGKVSNKEVEMKDEEVDDEVDEEVVLMKRLRELQEKKQGPVKEAHKKPNREAKKRLDSMMDI